MQQALVTPESSPQTLNSHCRVPDQFSPISAELIPVGLRWFFLGKTSEMEEYLPLGAFVASVGEQCS